MMDARPEGTHTKIVFEVETMATIRSPQQSQLNRALNKYVMVVNDCGYDSGDLSLVVMFSEFHKFIRNRQDPQLIRLMLRVTRLDRLEF